MEFVSKYCVIKNGQPTAGALFYADIFSFMPLPDYEIAEVFFSDAFPNKLTYPDIQPPLFDRVQGWEACLT